MTMQENEYLEVAKMIWKTQVPPSGPSDSIQGELLRCNEKLRDEAHRNGNINWWEGHAEMATFMQHTLLESALFSAQQTEQIKSAIQDLLDFEHPTTSDKPYDFLMDRIVDWHLAQKSMVPLSESSYLHGYDD